MLSRLLDNPNTIAAGFLLAAIQLVAALPWLWAIDPRGFARALRSGAAFGYAGGVLAGCSVAATMILNYKGDTASLQVYGRYVYGAALHMQLLLDLFILMPIVLVAVWPKGGAVAYAAYREGWRQPTFWLIIISGGLLTWLSVVIPYFTFGDDYKMMKQIGFDIVMLAAVVFGILAASMSISEEIEGRTAVTLMSKPISRRQFLIGKFLGILMACLAMTLVLSWNMTYALRVFPEYDKINIATDPMCDQAEKVIGPVFADAIPSNAGSMVARGAGGWFADTLAHSSGLMLGFGQVMILVAIASALATRMAFAVNLILCFVIYLLGHLSTSIVQVTERTEGTTTGLGLIGFLGKLFNVVLPDLEFFNMAPAIIRESSLDLWQFSLYVLTVFGYSIIYTIIALLVGLLMFDDRDLA